MEIPRRDFEAHAELVDDRLAHHRIGDETDRLRHFPRSIQLPARRRQLGRRGLPVDLIVEKIPRRRDLRRERLPALRPDERVGIVPRRHLRHPHRQARLQQRRHRALRRLLPRRVRVEAQNHLRDIPLQNPRLLLRERRPLRRDHIFHTSLERRDQIDLPLAHNRRARVDQRPLRFVQAEQHVALRKKHRLRGVYIFRPLRLFIQHPPAERDHLAEIIANREHHPIPEPVVKLRPPDLGLRVRYLRLLLVPCLHLHQAAAHEFLLRESLPDRPPAQRVPRLRRIPDPPRLGHLGAHAAPF